MCVCFCRLKIFMHAFPHSASYYKYDFEALLCVDIPSAMHVKKISGIPQQHYWPSFCGIN